MLSSPIMSAPVVVPGWDGAAGVSRPACQVRCGTPLCTAVGQCVHLGCSGAQGEPLNLRRSGGRGLGTGDSCPRACSVTWDFLGTRELLV